jgi:hypothetical protein
MAEAAHKLRMREKQLISVVHFLNDEDARAFVHDACPMLADSYDCLAASALKADAFRYCAMWSRGGFYIDAEDVIVEPLKRLVRPCDTLVLALDWCQLVAGVPTNVPCDYTGVQISFMAAVKGHPFFKCAMDSVIRHVRRRFYGPNDLFVTGPAVAGRCLELFSTQSGLNYSFQLQQGRHGLYRYGFNHPMIQQHVLNDELGSTTQVTGYSALWRIGQIYTPTCKVPDARHAPEQAEALVTLTQMGLAGKTSRGF